MGRRNRLGLINDAVIVQEFVAGTEYIVDTASHDGHHRVAAIWRYRQPGSRHFGYDAIELLPATGDTQETLVDFTQRVLDALGIRYGPAHCELMWVDDAPVLIEIGARAHGGISPGVSRRCSGRGQLELTLDAYLDPERFLRSSQAPYPLDKRALIVFLIPGTRGVLKGLGSLSPLRRLSSFADASIWVRPGQPVHRALGRVILIHSDRRVLEGDLEHIRALMRNGLCKMEPPGEDAC
jgi:hypothetical protein